MWTYSATRVIAADRDAVQAAITAAVHQLWGEDARTIGGHERIDAIADDVWLTWHVESAGDATRLTLVLDEVEPGPDPTAGLEHVLDVVAQHADAASGQARSHG